MPRPDRKLPVSRLPFIKPGHEFRVLWDDGSGFDVFRLEQAADAQLAARKIAEYDYDAEGNPRALAT